MSRMDVFYSSKMGNYALDPSSPYLLFLPHCPRPLYEQLLTSNFSPLLSGPHPRLLLGNDLGDYLGFVRDAKIEEFEKPKKKRRGKQEGRAHEDNVLLRLGETLSDLC